MELGRRETGLAKVSMIPLSKPGFPEDSITLWLQTARSAQHTRSIIAEQCETLLAEISQRSHAYLTNSCTTALHALLRGLNIGEGDAVFVSSYSWQATANVIELVGAVPVFVDIDKSSFNMCPNRLEEEILRIERDGSLRPALVVVVHAFGCIANMYDILQVCQCRAIPVVEDAACALGATREGKPAGSFGIAAAFSFHPRKIVNTGEGGAFVSSSKELYELAASYCDHGRATNDKSDFMIAGTNYRLSELAAALLLPQLKILTTLVQERRTLARRYLELLDGLPGVSPTDTGDAHSWQSFVFLIPEGIHRSQLIAKARATGIELGTGTVAMPFTRYFRSRYSTVDSQYPTLSMVHQRALSLPLYSGLSFESQSQVASFLMGHLR